MPDSSESQLVTLSVEEVRQLLVVALTVMPRHVLRALWEPKERLKDQYRCEAVARMTDSWSDWTITRPAGEHDVGRIGLAAATAANGAAVAPTGDAWTVLPVRTMTEAFDDQAQPQAAG